jgi:hypothetical protein
LQSEDWLTEQPSIQTIADGSQSLEDAGQMRPETYGNYPKPRIANPGRAAGRR